MAIGSFNRTVLPMNDQLRSFSLAQFSRKRFGIDLAIKVFGRSLGSASLGIPSNGGTRHRTPAAEGFSSRRDLWDF